MSCIQFVKIFCAADIIMTECRTSTFFTNYINVQSHADEVYTVFKTMVAADAKFNGVVGLVQACWKILVKQTKKSITTFSDVL